MGAIVLGHDDQAAGVFVESVDDAGAQVAAGGGERLEAVEQRIDQRAAAARVVALARAGVDHHSGRLVDDREVGVFVDNVQRNVFRSGLERRGARLAGDVDALAAAQLERGLLARGR